MRTVKAKRFLLIVTLVGLLTVVLMAQPMRDHNPSTFVAQKRILDKSPNEYAGPVVDYKEGDKTLSLTDSKGQALKESRSSRYDKRASQPLGETPPEVNMVGIQSDLTTVMPALPVNQSDAVVLGEVIDAQAYLSNDKTGVYSEFTIRVKELLKDNSNASLSPGEQTIAEREGGVVRFSSGRLIRYQIFNQTLPRMGWQYVFFLKYNNQGQDYIILTGYLLRKGRVSPLDKPTQFAAYEGADENNFLNGVREAITHPSQRGPDKERSGQ